MDTTPQVWSIHITATTSPPQLAPYAPRVFGLHPASNGISRGLIEAGRQLHQRAGSLAWEQGVTGLRGIGPCLGVLACSELHLHSMYTMGAPKPFGSSSWAAGGGGCPRLAELREQACNTDQGDLVMDIRLTESPLCLLNICVECNGSSWLSPTMADSVLKKSAKCCYCILCSPVCLIKSAISNFCHIVSAQTEWLRLKNKQSNRPNCSSANESHLQNRPKACRY